MPPLTKSMIDRFTSQNANRERFTYDHVEAALCIMEEVTNTALPDGPAPWREFRESHGSAELRRVIIENLAEPCDAAWARAFARYEAACEEYQRWEQAQSGPVGPSPPIPREPGSFDYDFVPVWLRECVDWGNVNDKGWVDPRPRYDPARRAE